MGFGRLGGPKKPCQEPRPSASGNPFSLKVGTPGSCAVLSVAARILNAPLFMWGTAALYITLAKSTCFPRRVVTAGAPPLAGTGVISTPYIFKTSRMRWAVVPTPAVEQFNAPGFSLANFTTASREVKFEDVWFNSIQGATIQDAIGVKSLKTS